MKNKSAWKWIVGTLVLIAVIYGAVQVFGEPEQQFREECVHIDTMKECLSQNEGKHDGTIFDDVLQGTSGTDDIAGLMGNDTLYGYGGDDILYGGLRDDVLYGGDGADTLDGGIGDDRLDGGLGQDNLDGGSGKDILLGAEGDDTLFGDSGDDILHGGEGDDMLTGGTGTDRFVFEQNAGNDTITDFEDGVDQIQLIGGDWQFNELGLIQSGDDVIIKTLKGLITLQDTDVANIDASDFVFALVGDLPGTDAEVGKP